MLPKWRQEIEAITGGRIVIVPVVTNRDDNTLRIPPDFPGRAVVRRMLMEESLVRQFIRAHALNVNYAGAEGVFHFILLNTAMGDDWKGSEEALLGHEYGHIWLNGLGYRSPRYENGSDAACVLTHAGDIVQHVLIREEARRRQFNYLAFWTRSIEHWLQTEVDRKALDACQRVQLVAMYVDTVLALNAEQWPPIARFEERIKSLLPEAEAPGAALRGLLSATNLWDRSLYEYALQRAIELLSGVYRR